MHVTSTTFSEGQTIPDSAIFNEFGLHGGNRSPQLSIADVPDGTKSLAIVCHDPDAPTSGGFYHWVFFNIPADTREIPEGAGAPDATAIKGAVPAHNDYGRKGYGGPCPPPGPAHHYHFTVHALKDMLPLDASATGALVEFMAGSQSLGKATITGLFARPS